MYLKNLTVFGFKSFADTTEFTFDQQVTGIVGPNGCGKSNIIDALLWVLGESSAKHLRGDSMVDVIFNGSNTRKPVGQASVELIFDNSDGTIQGEYAGFNEISIKRQVSRDGQSNYFLNNARCRRRDIVDVFLGTGLGARSYSIIEQGMISQIVEARPEDLRMHLEEAAGISKYKERRKETESRIKSTRENLDRLNDVRQEVEKTLEHLNRQAKAAERWQKLKGEHARVEAELKALSLKAQDAELEAKVEALKAIDLEIEEIFLHRPRPSVREAANQIRSLLIADNGDYRFESGDVPSVRTIERLIGNISSPQLARKTMGSKRRTAYEPHPGQYQSRGFLDLVQMDHSPANVMLVDSVRREALGRPWVTLLIEVWSRCILGFYVSFGDPSIFRCGRAVANALLPKQPLLAGLGMDEDYPIHGFFKRLHADHAGSHRAEVFRSACHAYGIDPDIRPRGPAHFGGHIERLIGTMCEKMLLLPGATGGDVTKRDGHDVEAAATMTLEEFERWFVREICRYHHTPHDGLGRIAPAQRWQDGAAEHGALVPLGIDVAQLTRRFLPWVERTVTAGGVQIGHRRYWHESFATRIGLKIMIHVDERTIQEVYPQIDEKLVAARVVGSFPHVTKVEWDAAAAALRNRGRAFQQSGGQTEIARLVHANRQEVQGATIRTREQRCLRKRLEREGISHSAGPPPEGLQEERAKWLPVEELGEVKWLKPINQ